MFLMRKCWYLRYSDAKTQLVLSTGSVIGFQINKGADGEISYIIPGWLDKVVIKVGGKEFTESQGVLHTFYGTPSAELLEAIASSEKPIFRTTFTKKRN